VNNLLNLSGDMPFPPHSKKFANGVESYFGKKITDIRASLDANVSVIQ